MGQLVGESSNPVSAGGTHYRVTVPLTSELLSCKTDVSLNQLRPTKHPFRPRGVRVRGTSKDVVGSGERVEVYC